MKFKKLTAMLAVTAVMATTLFGCGNETKVNTSESIPVQTSETTVTSETTEEVKEFSYPMEGNPTVTQWWALSTAVQKSFASLNETPYAEELRKQSGINVEFIHPNSDNVTEAFNLMLADQDYPDVMNVKGSQIEQFYADGVIIQLNDIIDEYMPNFKAFLEANPDIDKMIKSDDGIYYYIPLVMEDASMGCTYGVFARKDWMEELGITMPETIAEWHDALVKIKDAKGVAPIVSSAKNLLHYGAFLNAYCPDMNGSNYYSLDENGKVFFIPATDEYREFLTTMSQWYKEGLINPDIASLNTSTIRAKMAADEAAVSLGYAGSGIQKITNEAIKTNPDYTLTAVPTPAKEAGAEIKYASASSRVNVANGGQCITTKCENVEAAARYLDFYWSEAGYTLANFGIEGVSYTVENGEEVYTDWILNNPDGLAVNEAMAHYIVAYETFPGLQSLNYLKGYYSATPAAAEAPSIWSSKGKCDNSLTAVSHTLEESDELGIIQTELNTYVSESVVKFLLGTMDVETQWEEFITNLEKYRVNDAVAIKQAAYDRYLAK